MKIELSDKEAEYLIRVIVNSHGDEEGDYDPQDISCKSEGYNLLGKIIHFNTHLFEYFNQVRNSRHLKDKLNIKLFMGNGYHSLIDLHKLHKRLSYASSALSALEQNGGMGTEFDEQMDKECTENIKDVLKDIIYAFNMTPEELCEKSKPLCMNCGWSHPNGLCYDV